MDTKIMQALAGSRVDEESEVVALARKLEDPNVALGEKNLIVETHHDYYLKYRVFKAAADACGLALGRIG